MKRIFSLLYLSVIVRCQNDQPVTSSYNKQSTSFNGVTFESVPSYLSIQGNSTLYLPVLPSDSLNKFMNYTIMAWFKITEQPNIANPALLFTLSDEIACYVDSDFTFLCQKSDFTTIKTSSTTITIKQWFHVTLAISERGNSILQIETNEQVKATVSNKNFKIVQSSLDWKICFGQCIQSVLSFVGGVREFKIRSIFINETTATLEKNMILPFSTSLKAYFRFQGTSQQFTSDQYSANKLQSEEKTDFKTMQSFEMLPVDVCPNTYNLQEFYSLEPANPLKVFEIKTVLKQTNYSYTVMLTALLDQSTCVTSNVNTAVAGCNILQLEEVFMIYFQKANQARIHFFAQKSYFQSQSVSFFVPFNQVVTFQLSMNQYSGYKFFILNQWGQVITTFASSFDMQKQVPGQKLSLFTGLSGVVKSFKLYNQQLALPQYSDITQTPIVQLDLSISWMFSQTLVNQGSEKGFFQFANKPERIQIPYSNFLEGSESSLDGVTCQNNQLSLQLNSQSSQVNFTVPSYQSAANQSTVEFWFKLVNSATYNTSGHLFSLQDPQTLQFYWQIYLLNGTLVVSPFGLTNFTSPTIPIPEFKLKNEDQTGWWHLSCSYNYNDLAICTLYNTNIEVQQVTYLSYTTYFVPNSTLAATFGRLNQSYLSIPKVFIKEFRLWNKRQKLLEIQQTRYRQIDPNSYSSLKAYVRLIGGFENFLTDLVSISVGSQFNVSSTSYSSVSMLPDFILSNTTVYDKKSQSVQVFQNKQFHTICPLQTYYSERQDSCFSQPINEVVLAVFPYQNRNGSLFWLFTVEDSPVLNETLLWQMQLQWSSDDYFLGRALNKSSTVLNKLISSENFRQQDHYDVSAVFSNSIGTVLGSGKVSFVPDKCHWFEVDGSDAYSGYRQLNLVQGVQDISFFLVHIQNSHLDCSQFDYFTQLDSLSFKFIISNSDQYLTQQPEPSYQVVRNSSTIVGINITIPAEEQVKLPSWTDVKILTSISWKQNSSVGSKVNQGALFQHAMFKINFSPSENILVPSLSQSSNQITKGQDLVLDASDTTVTNYPTQMLKYSLLYTWECPKEIQVLCSGQRTNKLVLTWSSISRYPIKYGLLQNITLTTTWIQSYTYHQTKSSSVQMTWYNATMPTFTIQYAPTPVLVTANRVTTFQLSTVNFSPSELTNYNFYWKITPKLNSTAPIQYFQYGSEMKVQSGFWEPNTQYFVSLQLTFVTQPNISVQSQINFTTGGPPDGGNISVLPLLNLQNQYMVVVSGWQTKSKSPIFYNVFNTFDQEGLQRSSQLNSAPVPQNKTLQFTLTTGNPIQVQVLDVTGETITQIIKQPFVYANSSLNNETTNQQISNLTALNQTATNTNSSTQFPTANQTLNSSIVNTSNLDSPTNLAAAGRHLTSTTKELQQIKTELQNEVEKQILSGLNCGELLKTFDQLLLTDAGLEILLIPLLERVISDKDCLQQDLLNQVFKRLEALHPSQIYKGQTINLQSVLETNQIIQTLDAQLIIQSSPQSVRFQQDNYMQIISVKGLSSYSGVRIRSYNMVDQQFYELESQNGALQISFDYIRSTFEYNKTQCAVRNINTNQWSSDQCLTEYEHIQSLVQCTCNMIESDLVTVIEDFSRVSGGQIVNKKAENLLLKDRVEIKASSYVFMTVFVSLFTASILMSFIAWRQDQNYQMKKKRNLTQQENEFASTLATKLQTDYSKIEQQIDAYMSYTVRDQCRIVALACRLHPLIYPFQQSTQQRLLQMSGYALQLHIYSLGCLWYFNSNYRLTDQSISLYQIDSFDIQQVAIVVYAAGLFLLPLLQQPLNYIVTSHQDTSPRLVRLVSILVIGICQATNLTCLVTVFILHLQLPAVNQYLVTLSLVGGILFAVILTNGVRIYFNYYAYRLNKRTNFFTCQAACKVLDEMETAQTVWLSFTSPVLKAEPEKVLEKPENTSSSFGPQKDLTRAELVVQDI